MLIAALLLVVSTGAADGYSYPRFQPVSVAFADRQRGVLGEDDWTCHAAHGCESRLLTTSDGGKHWRVTDTVARGVELFPVCGTQTVYALMGDAMLRTDDAGLRWRRLAWGPAVVSFVTPQRGWRLRRVTTLAQPSPLSETGDAGRSWTARVDPCRGDYGVPLDTIAAQSADLLDDGTGFILLRGCRVRLVRTDVAATNATTIDQWNSPTQC